MLFRFFEDMMLRSEGGKHALFFSLKNKSNFLFHFKLVCTFCHLAPSNNRMGAELFTEVQNQLLPKVLVIGGSAAYFFRRAFRRGGRKFVLAASLKCQPINFRDARNLSIFNSMMPAASTLRAQELVALLASSTAAAFPLLVRSASSKMVRTTAWGLGSEALENVLLHSALGFHLTLLLFAKHRAPELR